MQALSQLSYSPKPKERHFPCQSLPCQGNIPVLSVTYAMSGMKNLASGRFSPPLEVRDPGGYWITTL